MPVRTRIINAWKLHTWWEVEASGFWPMATSEETARGVRGRRVDLSGERVRAGAEGKERKGHKDLSEANRATKGGGERILTAEKADISASGRSGAAGVDRFDEEEEVEEL